MEAGIVTRTLEKSMEPIKKFAVTTSLTRVPFAVKYHEDTGGGANKNKMEKFNERSTSAP